MPLRRIAPQQEDRRRMRITWPSGRIGRPGAPTLAAIAVLLAALLLRTLDPPLLDRVRNFAFDTYQRLAPRPYDPATPVRIVDIDEASLAAYGQWPWPRSLLADLVDKLAARGVAVVAFDAVLAEPDRTSLRRLARDLAGRADASLLEKLAAEVRDNDELLADSFAQTRVVTGFGFTPQSSAAPPRLRHGLSFTGDDPRRFLPVQAGVVPSLAILEAAAQGNGAINTDVDSAVVRRVPLLFRLAGTETVLPALPIEALRVGQGASSYLVKSSGASSELDFGRRGGIVAIRTGALEVPTDGSGRLVLWDTGHQADRFVSAADVLKDAVPADKLEGQLVFVGTSAIGLNDVRNTPVQDAVPGVEIQVQLAEQMVEQRFLARPDYADGLEIVYLAVAGALLIWLLPRLAAGTTALVAAGFIVVAMGASWFAYDRHQLLFDPVYPPLTLAAIYVTGTALAFMRTERERSEIRSAFGLYLSPKLVEQLARNPKLLELGGEQREITVMFTDVRGFTTISEQFDPHGLTRFMNRFLTPMTDLILARQGTIDKYMGDAIMAFWNAPLPVPHHAVQACDTALAMQATLAALNETWRAEAAAGGRPHLPVTIGIGLNTGLAAVGNFGSTQRFTYSCLGDEVNLASRLESLCKLYGVGIIVGEQTRTEAPAHATLEIDFVQVKGKTEPARLYALAGDPALAATSGWQALAARQGEFLSAYRAGAFVEALDLLAGCETAARGVWSQGYYEAMRHRLQSLIDVPPAEWNGVYVARDK